MSEPTEANVFLHRASFVDLLDVDRVARRSVNVDEFRRWPQEYPAYLLARVENSDPDGFSIRKAISDELRNVPGQAKANFCVGGLLALSLAQELCEDVGIDFALFKSYMAQNAEPPHYAVPDGFEEFHLLTRDGAGLPTLLHYADEVAMSRPIETLIDEVASVYDELDQDGIGSEIRAGFVLFYWPALRTIEAAQSDQARVAAAGARSELGDDRRIGRVIDQQVSRDARMVLASLPHDVIAGQIETELLFEQGDIEESLGMMQQLQFDHEECSAEMIAHLQEVCYPIGDDYDQAEAAKFGGALGLEAFSRLTHAADKNQFAHLIMWSQAEGHEILADFNSLDEAELATVRSRICEVVMATSLPQSWIGLVDVVADRYCESREAKEAFTQMFHYVYTTGAQTLADSLGRK